MQKIKAVLALSILGLFSSQAIANEAELSLNDDTVKIAGQFEMGGFDLEASILHNQDRGNIFGLGALMFGDAGAEGLNAGLGLKLAYMDPDAKTQIQCPEGSACIDVFEEIDIDGGVALPIGGKVTYVPADYNRFNAGAYLWYAPSVLAFGDAEKYQELGGYIGYNVTRNADIFLGYRNVKGKFDVSGTSELLGEYAGNFTNTFDTGFHLGIRGRF